MSRTDKLLAAMRGNPRDWHLSDVEAVCRVEGIACDAPTGGGSHYKIKHPWQAGILTIPARRPIKPVYIRDLIVFVDRVRGSRR